MEANRSIYKSQDVVNSYANEDRLQKPEEKILNLVKDQLKSWRVLDIGVGGGRTTLHFGKYAKEYIGIDYSEEMIENCNQRYRNDLKNASFRVCDVKNMEQFSDNSFDFILFSFNGIDYMVDDERKRALQEVWRVGKPNSIFVFSTHNIQSTPRYFNVFKQLNPNPERTIKNIYRHLLLKYKYNNASVIKNLKNSDFEIINDGAHDFRLKTYYISPSFQLKQLEGHFYDTKVYSTVDGGLISEDELLKNKDYWLYYFCRVRKYK